MIDVDVLRTLATGPLYRFLDWPVKDVPSQTGVYTIWRGAEFIYVGVAGRRLAETSHIASLAGLRSRLNSHASGRRSGDQLCIYVCDRLVLPLHSDRLSDIAAGHFSLDQATRDFVRSELGFRFMVTHDFRTALDIERRIKTVGLPDLGRPLLNPSITEPTASIPGSA